MKYTILAIFLSVLIVPISANADCIKDEQGKMVCGKGQCETDRYKTIFCADTGGGAVRDRYDNVQCGVGACVRDNQDQVWCSKEPGGTATLDSSGKAKCAVGCEPGSKKLCFETK